VFIVIKCVYVLLIRWIGLFGRLILARGGCHIDERMVYCVLELGFLIIYRECA